MQADPLKVEVDGRPENIGDPCPIVLFRSKKPLGILNQSYSSKRWPIYRIGLSKGETGIDRSHTGSRGPDT